MGEKKRRLASQPSAGKVDEPRSTRRARELFEAGRRAHRDGKLIEAVNTYIAALALAPELVEALHFQGLAMVQLGQREFGLGLLRHSVAQAPDNATFHFNLGQAARPGDAPAALSALRRAAALAPDNHDFAIAHAELLLEHNDVAASIDELERARVLRPQRWETLQGLAQLYYRSNQPALARARFEQGLAMHPELVQNCRIGFAAARGDRTETESAVHWADVPDSSLADVAALQQFVDDCDLHIIDDFVSDPAAYRRHALSLPFHQHRHDWQNYPGAQTDGDDCQEIMERIATTLGRDIKFMSPENGSYRISYADALARTDIHVDNESGDNFNFYAGVLYLNLPEQCQGGTTFWRHRPTGWCRRPLEGDVRAAGYSSFRHFQKRWLPNVAVQKFNELRQQRDDAWQAMLEVPMRHNRLIIYRAHYFHSISNVFGSTLADGRLVQLFFFELVDEAS